MENNKTMTMQICIFQFDHPYESMQELLSKSETLEAVCSKEEFKIKKFIGSDWLIEDSGFIFFGPNDLKVTFTIKSLEKNNFNRITHYHITYLDEKIYNNKLEVVASLIRNTTENNTIMELRINYHSKQDLENLEKYVNLSLVKIYIMQIYKRINQKRAFTKKCLHKN